MDVASPEYGSGLPGLTIEKPDTGISGNPFNSFDYGAHNEYLRVRWIQLRIAEKIEMAKNPYVTGDQLSRINTLDRFLGLALFRAQRDGVEADALKDINEMRGHLRMIDN